MIKKFIDYERNNRPDLLLVQFDVARKGHLRISPIEVKSRSGTFNKKELDAAINQAGSFIDFLQKLEERMIGHDELWKLVFPILVSEMVGFSLGLQYSNGLIGKNEVELVRDALEILANGKGEVTYCKSWVITISDRPVSESYEVEGDKLVVALKKADIMPLLEGDWNKFHSRCKSGFLDPLWNPCSSIKGRRLLEHVNEDAPIKDFVEVKGTNIPSNGIVVDIPETNTPTSSLEVLGVERDHSRDAKWEDQYKDIISIIHHHRVKLTAINGIPFIEGPAFVTYKIEIAKGEKVSSVEKLHDELKLGLRLAEDQRIRFKVDGGLIKIEVPKFQADRYFIDAKQIWSNWISNPLDLSIPIGEDQQGDIVIMNFSSDNSPHLLIGGSTGSGKSEALSTILNGLCLTKNSTQLKLILIDPKGTELIDFEGSPYLLREIGYHAEDALEVLDMAVLEMESRYELMRSKKVNKISKYNQISGINEFPWWLIVLDEYGDLTSSPDDKKAVEAKLKRLAQKARAAGIHIIVATQKPSGEVISTNIRSNLGAQLALKVRGGMESKVILDEVGAEALNGKGDALFNDGTKLSRIQVALFKK